MAEFAGRRRLRFWPGVLALLVVALVDCSSQASPPSAGVSSSTVDLAAQSNALLESFVGDADQPGCSAAVGTRGNVAWAGARGVASLKIGRPLSTRTSFEVASVEKQFIATAVLLLVEQKRLNLATPVANYIPRLPQWSAKVQLQHLLHHTSGIPDYEPYLTKTQKRRESGQAEAIAAIGRIKALDARPGTAFAYSDSNYPLLTEVVARVSQTRLSEYLDLNVFRPLSLQMFYDPDRQPADQALPYQQNGTGDLVEVPVSWNSVGAHGVQSSPSELVRWSDNYRTGRVGGQELLRLQEKGAVLTDDPTTRYGAGIFITADGALWHTGHAPGLSTKWLMSPGRLIIVVASCNNSTLEAGDLADQLEQAWA